MNKEQTTLIIDGEDLDQLKDDGCLNVSIQRGQWKVRSIILHTDTS
jgi:hypothetical protein